MKKILFLISIVLFFGFFAVSFVSAQCYFDDFGGTNLSTDWDTENSTLINVRYFVEDGWLNIVEEVPSYPQHMWFALLSRQRLCEDFDIEMPFKDFIRSTSEGTIGLGVAFDDFTLSFFRARSICYGGTHGPDYLIISGLPGEGDPKCGFAYVEENTDLSGTFRIKRTGNKLEFYFRGGEGEERKVYETTRPDLSKFADVYIVSRCADWRPFSVKVDYLKINKGCFCPCDEHNVWGWAFAENIGWTSFSCENCDSDFNGYIDVACGGDNSTIPSIDYGVDIDEVTGDFSGYAWSENIGWIDFDSVEVDTTNGNVSGWARACSVFGRDCPHLDLKNIKYSPTCCSGTLADDAKRGGWDGWIKLRDTDYNVWIDSSVIPSEFRDWGWGSDVVGWVSFNHLNCDSDNNGVSDGIGACPPAGTSISDYKVMTELNFNRPPKATISCNPEGCSVYEREPLILNNESTDPNSTNPPDSDNDIKKSEWFIDNESKCSCTYAKGCDLTPNNYVGVGFYTAKLYVEDARELSDTDTENFEIKKDIEAGFMCSLDNSTWEVCENLSPTRGQMVYFRDDPDLPEHSSPSQEAAINSRTWEKDGVVFDSDNNINPSTEAVGGPMGIKLTVVDSAGRTASKTHTITERTPSPEWREIVPFSIFDRFLAMIFSFFGR